MSVQVHVVMGSSGEYSDRTTWAVAAYQDRAKADDHADRATIEALRIYKESREDGRTQENIYDPDMYSSYTGADYYVMSVDLFDAIPGIDG